MCEELIGPGEIASLAGEGGAVGSAGESEGFAEGRGRGGKGRSPRQVESKEVDAARIRVWMESAVENDARRHEGAARGKQVDREPILRSSIRPDRLQLYAFCVSYCNLPVARDLQSVHEARPTVTKRARIATPAIPSG